MFDIIFLSNIVYCIDLLYSVLFNLVCFALNLKLNIKTCIYLIFYAAICFAHPITFLNMNGIFKGIRTSVQGV